MTERWHLWYRWLYRAFAALSLVVFASGLLLIFFYRPTAADAWEDIFALQSAITFSTVLRSVHRWSTIVWLLALIPLAVIEIVRQNILGGVLRLASIGLAALTAYLGWLLPWDQLALSAVTVGTDMTGFTPVLSGDDVRFVLLDGAEVDLSSLRTYFYLHVGLGTIVLVISQFARSGNRNRESVKD